MASGNEDSDKEVLTMAEVQKRATDKDKCIMVIDNRVYDITKFLDEVIHTIIRNKMFILCKYEFSIQEEKKFWKSNMVKTQRMHSKM